MSRPLSPALIALRPFSFIALLPSRFLELSLRRKHRGTRFRHLNPWMQDFYAW